MANGTASFYSARLSSKTATTTATATADAQAPTSTAGSKYDFNMVMGPDEYAYPVDNSAYTNAVAKIALDFAQAQPQQSTALCPSCHTASVVLL